MKSPLSKKNRRMRKKMLRYDVVIIGAGIAGLYAGMGFSRDKKVLIVSKSYPWECNTYYAQGGVTTAYNDADIPLHVADTLQAGAGLCNREAVEFLSEASQGVIADLIQRGFCFDTDVEGNLLYTKEAAHSRNRILHAGGDATGRHLHLFLLQQNPHPMLSNATVTDLLMDESRCCGVEVLSEGKRKLIYANNVIIASGGVGSLYEYHTNSHAISADLHGICLEKEIVLENMEMMQFHPTVFVTNSGARKQLLSEALRGEGAWIVDDAGYRFLFEYDERGEMAPRDIVSRAIFDYKQRTSSHVYLSCEHFDQAYFRGRFPNIYNALRDLGYSLPDQRVPISPAFHYAIGGIKSNLDGSVPATQGLYVIGEAACTGVHGANRLASNSLLEGLVFGKYAAQTINQTANDPCTKQFSVRKEPLEVLGDKEKKDRLRRVMWEYVSIKRTPTGLQKALEEITTMLESSVGRLLKLRLLSARSIVKSALNRRDSIGVHYITEA
jgi:L-aspartate oxidase